MHLPATAVCSPSQKLFLGLFIVFLHLFPLVLDVITLSLQIIVHRFQALHVQLQVIDLLAQRMNHFLQVCLFTVGSAGKSDIG